MRQKRMGLWILAAMMMLCLCFALPGAGMAEEGAAYSGLALTLDESGENLVAGKALWVLLEDGTRVQAVIEEGYTLSIEGIEDISALLEPVPAASPFSFTAVEETTATSSTGIPLFYYPDDEVSLYSAMIPGTLTVTKPEDADFSQTYAFGDAVTVTLQGDTYTVQWE